MKLWTARTIQIPARYALRMICISHREIVGRIRHFADFEACLARLARELGDFFHEIQNPLLCGLRKSDTGMNANRHETARISDSGNLATSVDLHLVYLH